MHYYPHHIGDYRADTAHLTNEEDLAYRRLLEMYYDTEKPIPLETQWVARRLRVGCEALATVLDDFFIKREDGYFHSRCDEIIAQFQRKAEKNRLNGKKGGRPKANENAVENPVGFQSQPSRNPVERQPITNNQEPITKKSKGEKQQKAFSPPTKNEVEDYCKERKNDIDPQRFVDYYSANGWMVGKNKMKDWRAAVRTWEGNSRKPESAEYRGPYV